MKKLISAVLTLTLVLTLSMGVFAAEQTPDLTQPGNATGNITANFEDPEDTIVHKYDITIAWEQSGTLIYKNSQDTYTWNSDNLKYDVTTDVEAGWTITDAKVSITVTNKSDLPIVANCAAPVAQANSTVTAIAGHYGDGTDTTASLNIESAANGLEGTGVEKTANAVYTITGVTGTIAADATTIGSITVTISAGSTSVVDPEP